MPIRSFARSLLRSVALPGALGACLVAGAATQAAQAQVVIVTPDTPEVRGPRLDVVFVIDATGSMGDEIEQVKEHLRASARSITSGSPRPEVRFGIVVYRDRTDTEPTRVVPLTGNVDLIHQQLANLVADGGGDTPEDVDAGLSLAVRQMEWAPDAAHMVFLVGDAGPKNYGVDRERLVAEARRREIRVHTLQASGMDEVGSAYFRHWSAATGGVAEVLTYRQVARVGGTPRTVFHRGGETWVSSRALAETESDLSFGELAERGLVHRDESAAAATSTGSTGSTGGAGGPGGPAMAARTRGSARPGRAYRAGLDSAPSAAAGATELPPSSAPSDSDVGGIIAREARREAAARGTSY